MATEKILRQYMAHFIDTANLAANKSNNTPSWYWLGDDLDEYDIELNGNVEIERDILGNEYIIHDYYEAESEADTNYGRKGDPMFEKLQKIVDNMYAGERCKTFTLDVHMWESPTWGEITVTSPSTNPKEKGWYEMKGGKHVLTGDTSPVSGKTYYYLQYPAVRRRCYITPISFGGDTSGYQIPFTVKYFNDPDYPNVDGLFDISDMKFNVNN